MVISVLFHTFSIPPPSHCRNLDETVFSLVLENVIAKFHNQGQHLAAVTTELTGI